MYFDPFVVKTMSEEEIVKIIKDNISKCQDSAETVSSLTKNVMLLTDVLFLYGELTSRMQERYALIKYENGIKEEKLIYKIKKEKEAKEIKETAGYYKAHAEELMKEDYEKEVESQSDLTRIKLAYDATQEKINAIKKKIDAIKFEFAAQ